MDNIVNGSKPSIIQYTKMGRKDNIELNAEESFFWSEEYRQFATQAYNLLNQPYYTKKDKLIAALEDKLQSLYTTAIGREQQFLTAIKAEKIKSAPAHVSSPENDAYAKEFNKVVKKKLYSNKNDLRALFQDYEYATYLSHSSNTFSLHASAQVKGRKVNTATYELANLFLTEKGKSMIEKGPQRSAFLETRKLTNRDEYNKWLVQFEKYMNDYIGEGIGTAALQSPEFVEGVYNNIGSIFEQEANALFNGTRRDIYFNARTNGTKKGVSEQTERELKNILKRVMSIAAKTSGVDIQFDTPIGPLSLSSDVTVNNGIYAAQVNAKLWTDDGTMISPEQMVDILYDVLYTTAISFAKSHNDYDWKTIEKDLINNKSIIRDIILTDINKNENEQTRTSEDVRKIIARWGYAQTRGILGELAAAIAVVSKIKGSSASVTGSDETEAGEVAMDVVVQIAGKKFGFQVKNFKSLKKQSGFYRTDFDISNQNIMQKYVGNAADTYYWLFANEKMLEQDGADGGLGWTTPIKFKHAIEMSLYDYSDNFLRISAGDTDDFTRSDAFFLKNLIIPSSYLYYLLIKTVRNAKSPQRFDFQRNTQNNKFNTLEENVPFKATSVQSLVSGLNGRIEFKGINFNLDKFE